MRSTFAQSMAWLHTWGGLVFAWALFAIFATGALAVFDREITYWMTPELHGVGTAPDAAAADAAHAWLARHAAGADRWNVALPDAREPAIRVNWRPPTEPGAPRPRFERRFLDPATGEAVDARTTQGGGFFFRFHFSLDLARTGIWIVGAAAIAMLAALVSGVVIHRRIFRDMFTFRPVAAAQRAWLDAHNASGVLLLPFHFMIAFTGLVIFWGIYLPAGITTAFDGDRRAFNATSSPPLAERAPSGIAAPLLPLGDALTRAEHEFGADQVRSLNVVAPGDAAAVIHATRRVDDRLRLAGDRVAFDGVTGAVLDRRTEYAPVAHLQRVMAGLHFAQFGGAPMRWLYFLAATGGAVMFATGLVLFAVKRRHRHAESATAARAYRFADAMTVAGVAGLLAAGAAYLWANRLLPATLDGREVWEVRAFYGVWALALGHAMLRGGGARAWAEQLAVAGGLCLLLPVVNALTATHHLGATLAAGDWRLAGVDLTALALGLGLLWPARRAGRHGRVTMPAVPGAIPARPA
ncbi:MAG: PepSY-associated TM helix domain-containing protein [Alphaproteobacteria bacterium]